MEQINFPVMREVNFSDLNQPIQSIELMDHMIIIGLEDGNDIVLSAVAECCSESWFHNGDALSGYIGRTITSIDQDMNFESSYRYNDYLTEYDAMALSYRISFADGDYFDLILLNDNNGYYSGWMEVNYQSDLEAQEIASKQYEQETIERLDRLRLADLEKIEMIRAKKFDSMNQIFRGVGIVGMMVLLYKLF